MNLSLIRLLLLANLIDGYCCFVNDTDQSFLLKKQQLYRRQQQQGGAASLDTVVQVRATADSTDGAAGGRQKKFKVSYKV